MMTIVTHVHLREGSGRDWDAAMRTRLSAAREAPGWIGGQLLRPADKPDKRVIVGTWRTRSNWEAWHHDPQFTETRQRLEGLARDRARRAVVARCRARCPESLHADPANLQVSKQAEGEGQDEESTKALGLTIPSSTTRHGGTAVGDAFGRARQAERAAPLP
jgi:heme-degrading monooxygenase HmoA